MMADQKHRDQSRKTEGSLLEPQQEAERKWEECVVCLLNLQPAPQQHPFSSKAIPPKHAQTAPPMGTKYSNI